MGSLVIIKGNVCLITNVQKSNLGKQKGSKITLKLKDILLNKDQEANYFLNE